MGFTALMYHSLSDGQHPDSYAPKYTTTLGNFRNHLAVLREGGFRLCSAGELLAARDAGQVGLHHACVLTFDDGHRSSVDMAEVMLAHGARGTFFVTKDYCETRPDFLNRADIQNLAAQGFDFGTHGQTHRPLRSLSSAELKTELVDSRHWLEDILGKPVEMMSLPAGKGGAAVRESAFENGYRLIANSRERNNAHLAIPGELNRFVILAKHSGADVARIAAASPRYILIRRMRALALWLPKKLARASHRVRTP